MQCGINPKLSPFPINYFMTMFVLKDTIALDRSSRNTAGIYGALLCVYLLKKDITKANRYQTYSAQLIPFFNSFNVFSSSEF